MKVPHENGGEAPPMAGIDGCPAGWIVAVAPSVKRGIDWHLCPTISDAAMVTAHCEVVAIDIPIGLEDAAEPGGRPCDREARRLLPAGWKSSVFAPPVRPVLEAGSYEEALRLNRSSSPHQLGISIQAWNIVAKIREVDEFLRRTRPHGWHETFPELAFLRLNGGRPLKARKKTPQGQRERRGLLTQRFGAIRPSPDGLFPRAAVQVDDLWDALVCCHVAGEIHRGTASLAGNPERLDRFNLPMLIRF